MTPNPSEPAPLRHTTSGFGAQVGLWWAGARPKTLGVAVSPVLVGTSAGALGDSIRWGRAIAALVVALSLQVGVNYANDYSDGIRGTDDVRAGPLRLVGSKLAAPRAVLTAALVSLGVAAVAGVALAWFSAPWLIAVGAVCIAGAWLYTGGSKPYGYLGLGEVAVFVFFGLVAVLGTQYTQALRVDWVGLALAVAMGSLSSAVLVANNLRDIPTDTAVGKRTLAVRIGDQATRALYRAVVVGALILPLLGWLAGQMPAGALLALAAIPLAAGPMKTVGYARGSELVRVLLGTVLMLVQFGVFLAIGLWLS